MVLLSYGSNWYALMETILDALSRNLQADLHWQAMDRASLIGQTKQDNYTLRLSEYQANNPLLQCQSLIVPSLVAVHQENHNFIIIYNYSIYVYNYTNL